GAEEEPPRDVERRPLFADSRFSFLPIRRRVISPTRSTGPNRGGSAKAESPRAAGRLELEPGRDSSDARRQNAAVDTRRIEVRRPRRIQERVRRIRVQDVEDVDAGANLSAAQAEILGYFDVEHVERRTDLRPVRLDTDRDGAELIDRRAAVGILRAEEHGA